MPIAIDGNVYDDEVAYTAKVLGIQLPTPEEAPGSSQTQGGTQVPSSENNAPRGNVEGVRPLPEERYQTWPEKMVRGAIQAFALPGDVYSGKVQPGSPQEIERAMDLAGLMVGGPAPVAAKMADGTLGSFAGVVSKTLPKEKLKMAQKLESEGASVEDIWKQTGFFKSKSDSRWRYEISDDNAKLTDRDWRNGDKGKLSEFFDHPELYKAYPELKDTNFEVRDMGSGNLGGYNPNTKTIVINPKALHGDDKLIQDTIHHEIQHRIQDIEGFTNGSSAAAERRNAIQAIRNRIADLHVEHNKDVGALYEDPRFFELNNLHDELTNPYSKFNMSQQGREDFGTYMYTRQPGEVEANQVIVRRKMTPEERAKVSPERLQQMLVDAGYRDEFRQKARQPFYYPK